MRGQIKQRSKGKGSWTVIVSYRDNGGRRRQLWRAVRGPKRKAEAERARLIHEIETGTLVEPSKVTVADFLRRWLSDYAATHVRPRTLEGYKVIVERRLIPALGGLKLTDLRPSHLQRYYSEALEAPRLDGRPGKLSARTVLSHHRVLREALGHALKWGLVARNVAQAVDPPRPVRKEMATVDSTGVRKLLEAAQGTVYYPILHLLVYTGLRRSEVLGLHWKDVDLDMGTLSVVQVMHRLRDGRIIFQEPKTPKGRRQVALSPTAVLAMKAHRERQEADRGMMGNALLENDIVFSKPDGSPFLPDSLTHAFARIVRHAGLSGIRLHDLRHTHASLMLRQGIHPKVVQERLGHSTISVTLDTYSHVTPGLQEAAALKFDEGLAEMRQAPSATPLPVRQGSNT